MLEHQKLPSETQIIMGHFSKLRTRYTDGRLIAATCKEMGFEVLSGKHAYVRGYVGQRTHADIVCVLKGDYDLGFLRNEEGGYDLTADLWGVSLQYNQTELITGIFKRYSINSALKSSTHRSTKLLAANYDTWLQTEHMDCSILLQRFQEIGFSRIRFSNSLPYLNKNVVPELAIERRTPAGTHEDRSATLLWMRNQVGSLDLNIFRGWQLNSLAEVLSKLGKTQHE